jgi:PAS domain S-box-containing protein
MATETRLRKELKRVPSVNWVFQKLGQSRLKIGTRLTLCFVVIVLLMMVADILSLLQFDLIRRQTFLLNRVDQKTVSVLKLHAQILTFRAKLEALASQEDFARFASEAATDRQELFSDIEDCRRSLQFRVQGFGEDSTIQSILQAIESSLPEQVQSLNDLAAQGDWQAVRFRLQNQTKDLSTLTNALVEKVDQEVIQERNETLRRISEGQQFVWMVFPITVVFTLITAVILGLWVTRSITRPLARLHGGAQAWARGELDYQVEIEGKDEFALLGQVFNDTSGQLHHLYKVLRHSESRFRSLIEHSSDLIALLNSSGEIRYVSPSSERILGLRPEELQGRTIFDFIHPEDASIAKDFLRRRREGIPLSAEVRCIQADGSVRTLEVIARDLTGDPSISAIVMNARDITDRKLAAKALALSEEKYRAFFERNLAGNYIASADGRLQACNPAFVQIFGFLSEEEAMQANFGDFFPSPSAYQAFLEKLKQLRHLESYEEEYHRKDGTPLLVTANAIGTFDEKGNLLEINGFLIDETERRKSERYFRQSQKMEAIGRLAGGIAHDFNNLLGIILGCSSLILERADSTGATRQDAQEILEASKHASALTRQLLAFSRKQVLQPKVLKLNQIIEDTDKMLRRLIGEDVEMKTILDPNLLQVKADASQMEQVILNLCVNARDAMPNGGSITIETSNVTADEVFAAQHLPMQPGRYACLSVSDTGTGMSKEVLSHIFEPFFTTKGPDKGTGLGLSTVYGIVKQSGGHISAYSEPGQGTRFLVYIPATTETVEQSEWDIKKVESIRGTETILLVEDAEALRALTRKILENCGYTVLEAADPQKAIQVTESYTNKIDLLLTDVVMPHMGGPALAEFLLTKRPEMKVLFMSGYTDEAMTDLGLGRGGAGLLEKPFTMQALAKKIREVLTDSKEQVSPRAQSSS